MFSSKNLLITMGEDFLHYLWKYKKFNFSSLRTSDGKEVLIKKVGDHNTTNSGPDFFNAQLTIDAQLWAGTVEIHKKSSDWYAHHHEKDPAYDNVILHVVWEDDVEIFRRDASRIPALELQKYVDPELLQQYQELFANAKDSWIQCQDQITEVPDFIISNWQERLFFERLEHKSTIVQQLLHKSQNDWEAVLFKLLFKNFGLKVNGDAFLSIANAIDFSVVRKCANRLDQLEALFFGQAGLLSNSSEIDQEKVLLKEYEYLKHKFQLTANGVLPVQFFRLRPPNFPTIRLSQLAQVYIHQKHLFKEIIDTTDLEKFYTIFSVATSSFWRNHYTFKKESAVRNKTISKEFIHLLIVNTIVPIKFLYAKSIGKSIEDEILLLISQLPAEKNSIIQRFTTMGVQSYHAIHSQALLQLKNEYCDHKACLQCGVGNYLLNRVQNLG